MKMQGHTHRLDTLGRSSCRNWPAELQNYIQPAEQAALQQCTMQELWCTATAPTRWRMTYRYS